jgi:hypothetical protein
MVADFCPQLCQFRWMRSVYENPEHWRDRADEARATASYAHDPEVRATMLRIAGEYDRLDRLTEGHSVEEPPVS